MANERRQNSLDGRLGPRGNFQASTRGHATIERMRELLHGAAEIAAGYLENLEDRSVAPSTPALPCPTSRRWRRRGTPCSRAPDGTPTLTVCSARRRSPWWWETRRIHR